MVNSRIKMIGLRITTVNVIAVLTACTIGPITITKDPEKIIKIRVASGYDPCKFRLKPDYIKLVCEWPLSL